MDYQTMKDEQESLRAAYEREKTNELLFGSSAGEEMSQITSGRNSAERSRNPGEKQTSFHFSQRTKSVQPIRVQLNGQSPGAFSKKRSYDIVMQAGQRGSHILVDDKKLKQNKNYGFGKQESSKVFGNADYSPLPSIMKKGNFGMRNNSQAMTFSTFQQMPKIDTRELNNNSGLRQHENRSI